MCVCVYIVAYRPVAKQWLSKQRPLLGNARNIHACSNRRTAFSMWPAPRLLLCNGAVDTPLQESRDYSLRGPFCGVFFKTIGATAQLRDIRRAVTTWAWEAEGSSLLRAVARERLLKTQQNGQSLGGWYDDLWILEISGGAVITCTSKRCIQVVSKSIH
jgi:hypothetical protein